MLTRILPLALCALTTALSAQGTYDGRGNTLNDSDGAVAGGALELSDDGADLTVDLILPPNRFFVDETVVMYVDTRPGGFSDNAAFDDNADDARIAASGRSGGAMGAGQLAPLAFPTDFGADFAIVIQNGATTVFELRANATHDVVTPAPTQVKANGTVTSVIPLSHLGSPSTFAFVTVYRYRNAALTDESYTEDLGPGNPGFDPVTLSSAASYSTSITLPVSLRRFDATAAATGVDLAWETASERDNAGFAVERSRDGRAWTEIGFVTGGGDASAARGYGFRDGSAEPGRNYYRLRQVDYDGTEAYSAVVTVDFGLDSEVASGLQLEGAHPVRDVVTVRNVGGEPVDASLFDAAGRLAASFHVGGNDAYRLDVSNLAAGTYVLRGGTSARLLMVR